MLAKRFFYVSAGILCLALAYHLGAASAKAQSGPMLSLADVSSDSNTFGGLVGRRIVSLCDGRYCSFGGASDPIPGTSPVVAIMPDRANFFAVLGNGDCFEDLNGAGWSLVGNLLAGSPVNAQSSTWGQIKARYR